MHRNVRRVLLALGITLIVLPAAISDGHVLTHHQAQLVHQAR
jgi:putative NIF3 family GTP cyclohydrolase 1 type 2